MGLNRFAILIATVFSALCLYGNDLDSLRALIPTMQGVEKIHAYGRLYTLSLQTDDLDYQLQCISDVINEAHRQRNREEEEDGLINKIVLFYNNDINDSVYAYVPQTLALLKETKDWPKFYETWSLLVNTYTFGGRTKDGLDEGQAMFDDAVTRNNKFGMGMAYYAMGNAYANMQSLDEAAQAYQQSIDMLMKQNPVPMQLSDIFAQYADILQGKKEYVQLEILTKQWRTFLENISKAKGLTNETAVMNDRWYYYYLACAQASLGLGDLEKAESMLEETKKRIYAEEGIQYNMWLYSMAQLCLQSGKYKEALIFNNRRMLGIGEDDDKAIQIMVREQRAEILLKLNHYEEAAQMYKEAYIMNDSINKQETKRQLTEMNARYAVDELKMEQAKAQTRNAIIIASIIVVALVIFIYFRIRAAKRLKQAHEKLEQTHEQLEKAHDDLLVAYDQLEETTTAKERIESELRIARDIQMGMVPQKFPPFPERNDIDLFASMTPAKEVGGDLYDFILRDDKLYFCLGDVSGKGVPASLFMAVARNLFRVVSQQGLPPAEIATKLNNALAEDNENGMFVTMFIGIADLKTGHMDFCNAGHNPPVIKEQDGNARFLEMEPNAPLGLWPGLDYVDESIDDISMKPFFVYSDGLNEAMNPEQIEFGDDHLLEIIQNLQFESAQRTIEQMKEEVTKHVNGAEQSDDLTMLCIRITGKDSNN